MHCIRFTALCIPRQCQLYLLFGFLLASLPFHFGQSFNFVHFPTTIFLSSLWYINGIGAAASRWHRDGTFPVQRKPKSNAQFNQTPTTDSRHEIQNFELHPKCDGAKINWTNLDLELRSWLLSLSFSLSLYFECDEIEIERRSDRSRSRSLSFDLLFLRCLLLWCFFGVRLRERERPIFSVLVYFPSAILFRTNLNSTMNAEHKLLSDNEMNTGKFFGIHVLLWMKIMRNRFYRRFRSMAAILFIFFQVLLLRIGTDNQLCQTMW